MALVVKNSPASARDKRDSGLIPGLRWPSGGGHGNLLQYSCLENPMDRGGWWVLSLGPRRDRYDWSHLACKTHCHWWSRKILQEFPSRQNGQEFSNPWVSHKSRCNQFPWLPQGETFPVVLINLLKFIFLCIVHLSWDGGAEKYKC